MPGYFFSYKYDPGTVKNLVGFLSGMETDRKTLLIASSVFVVLAFAGFYAGNLTDKEVKYDRTVNFTVNPGRDIVTARFNGESIDIMRESRSRVRFYLDLDRDGNGAENQGELTDLTRNGTVQETTELVNLDGTNYRLYFRYRDDGEIENDGWLTLYRVKEL